MLFALAAGMAVGGGACWCAVRGGGCLPVVAGGGWLVAGGRCAVVGVCRWWVGVGATLAGLLG